MGWWTRNLETDAVTWSPELEALFGVPAGSFGGDESAFLELVLPEDRAAVDAGRRERHREPDRLRRRVPLPPRRRHGPLDGRPRARDLRRATGRSCCTASGWTSPTGCRPRRRSGRARSASGSRRGRRVRAVRLRPRRTAGCTGRRELHRILGTDGDGARSRGRRPIHPDDREETLERFAAAQATRSSDGSFDFEYRMVRPDGGVRWVSTHGQTYFSEPTPSPARSRPPLDRRRRRHHGSQAGRRAPRRLPRDAQPRAADAGDRDLRRQPAPPPDEPRRGDRRRSSTTSSARASASSGSSRTSSSSPGPSATSSRAARTRC